MACIIPACKWLLVSSPWSCESRLNKWKFVCLNLKITTLIIYLNILKLDFKVFSWCFMNLLIINFLLTCWIDLYVNIFEVRYKVPLWFRWNPSLWVQDTTNIRGHLLTSKLFRLTKIHRCLNRRSLSSYWTFYLFCWSLRRIREVGLYGRCHYVVNHYWF